MKLSLQLVERIVKLSNVESVALATGQKEAQWDAGSTPAPQQPVFMWNGPKGRTPLSIAQQSNNLDMGLLPAA